MDVFISYARSSEPVAVAIEAALRAAGHDVWRDNQLPAHHAFADTIEQRLNAAKAVVVLWSRDATASEWVRSEADRARQQRKLVQVMVEPVALPMPFDQFQCIDLTSWRPGVDGPGWRQLMANLAELSPVRAPPAPAASSAGQNAEEPSPTHARSNLPGGLGQLFGRDEDLQGLLSALELAPCVSLVGAGGVGKTRLAIEAARRRIDAFEDGVWLVELASVTEADRVAEAVAKGMRLELPAGHDGVATLVDRLRRRECLIVIDNCEHLIDAVAALSEAVLTEAPQVKLVLTSQEPLRIAGEQVYRLQSLSPKAGVALFLDRAKAIDPAFAASAEEERAIRAMCQRLDGVPLAIEMAAARAPALGVATVLQRLDDRFRTLTAGRRTALPKHRTLVAALDWSHSLLSERDRIIFRRLSVFAGSFTLEAATATAADEAYDAIEVTDAVSSLVSKSLLSVRTSGGGKRYVLLETTKSYALEKLQASGEAQAFQRRHAEWCLQFARPFWYEYISQISDADLLARQAPEIDNINRALDWAYGPDGDVRIGHGLLAASSVRLDDRSLRRRHQVAYPRLGEGERAFDRAWLLCSRAHITFMFNPADALEIVDEAIAAAKADIDEPVRIAEVVGTKAFALWTLGRTDEARPVVDEALALLADQPPSRIKAHTLGLHACLLLVESGPEAAAPLFQEAIATLESFGARGDATAMRRVSLREMPPADPDADIQAWRALLMSVAPGDLYAEQQTLAIIKDLTLRLARRARPHDIREVMELARLALKGGPAAADRTFILTLGIAALHSGRERVAAKLVGYAAAGRNRSRAARLMADLEQARAMLIAALGETEFTALAKLGEGLDKAEAIRLALDEA